MHETSSIIEHSGTLLQNYSWIIPVLPLLSFLVIVLFTRENRKLSAGIAISAVGLVFLYSIPLLFQQIANNVTFEMKYGWMVFPTLEIQVGILIDSLTTIMLIVGFLVMLLSGFATLREFGYLTALTMAICLLSDLLLLPALLVRLRA